MYAMGMKNDYNKLTVYVPKEIVQGAKRYCLDNYTTLSEIIRKHLASLQDKKKA